MACMWHYVFSPDRSFSSTSDWYGQTQFSTRVINNRLRRNNSWTFHLSVCLSVCLQCFLPERSNFLWPWLLASCSNGDIQSLRQVLSYSRTKTLLEFFFNSAPDKKITHEQFVGDFQLLPRWSRCAQGFDWLVV